MLDAGDLARWEPIAGVRVPAGPVYLAIDVDVGDATRGVRPDDALALLAAEERSPLTVDEGIALVAHDPGVVYRNHGVQFPGSRCGDRRVTAIWLSEGSTSSAGAGRATRTRGSGWPPAPRAGARPSRLSSSSTRIPSAPAIAP